MVDHQPAASIHRLPAESLTEPSVIPAARRLPAVADTIVPAENRNTHSSGSTAGTIQLVAHFAEEPTVEVVAPPNDIEPSDIEPSDVAFSSALFSGVTGIDELVEYALENNPNIAAARSKAGALAERVPQSESLSDPRLGATVFLESIETAAGPQDVMLSLAQKFPWFGKRPLRGDVAFHEAQVAWSEMAQIELKVIEQVKLAYFELYFLDQAVRVNRALEIRLADVIDITRTKYETNTQQTGLESVLQAEVVLAKLQATFVELEQARRRAVARLAEALHLPQHADLDIEARLPPAAPPHKVDRLVSLIESCQPQLDARRHQMLRNDASLSLATRDYYPDVSVGFNWYAIGESGLSAVATGDDAYAVTIGMDLPIYRQRLDAALREAQLRTAQSADEYDATWDQLRATVIQLHAQAIEQRRVLDILDRDILPRSEQTLDLSIEAYRLDRIGFQQLIDNYRDLLQLRIDYYRRETSLQQVIARLERLVGCAVVDWPADLEPVPAGEVDPENG